MDRQVLENEFDNSLWGEDYENIIDRIEKSKNITKDLYEKIYKGQLGVDL
jgi:hypothetical protein